MSAEAFELPIGDIEFSVTEAEIRRREGEDWGREVIGQPRALEALLLGTGIRALGYNVYVTGAPGTGRRTAVLRVLEGLPAEPGVLRDIAYAYNFRSPLEPCALVFPRGQARSFKSDLHALVENMKRLVRLQTESADYRRRLEETAKEVEAQESRRLTEFEEELATQGFRVVQSRASDGSPSMEIMPLRNGEPADFDELQALVTSGRMPEEEWNRLRGAYVEYMDRLRILFTELRRGRVDLERRLENLRHEVLRPSVLSETEYLRKRYTDPRIHLWISDLEKDLLQHLRLFLPDPAPEPAPPTQKPVPPLARYGLNILVDNGSSERRPVILENHPTGVNLFGFVESRVAEKGDTRTAYLKIRPGALHRADGGFLILRAEDLVQSGESWQWLKRALQTGSVEFPGAAAPYGVPSAAAKPQPAEVDVKVLLLGGEMTYDILYAADPDFRKLFKVCAEFDSTMPRTDETVGEYVAFIRKIVREEGLLPAEPDAIIAVVEYGVRLSGNRSRLSTRFGQVADLLREASWHAGRAGRTAMDAGSVTTAVSSRAYLASLPEEKVEEMISSGEIILQVSGRAVGRVNGLAVHDRGYYAFGMPAVISAQVSPGEVGVINIEGESGLSGEIYDKAVLIVEGFLRSRYARGFPLMVTASICFEQSYTAIEGDSASSTAVYALLSAIAGIPLRQDIAVTGSLNQMGQVQPVGGITEKIEGFYQVCRRAGFTGTQGVLIPRQNCVNLTLSRPVQEAIREGRFMIWAVSSIDEGVEVLTGMGAGAPDQRGEFPPDSFNAKVRKELRRMARTIKTYMG
ncbi:MAG TPA: AAA family ATPase [Magnetospirillaceae bacterium]|nr:AAA family ATPase [Magnetospirillaceae bacterium]